MKHNYINDEIELDFDPGKRINSYIKMLENMDLNQQEELYRNPPESPSSLDLGWMAL